MTDFDLEKPASLIHDCGRRYRAEQLDYYVNIREELLGDWWKALEFFWGRAFYQGRLDEVSSRVKEVAEKVLERNKLKIDQFYESRDWTELRRDLLGNIGKGKIGKARDVDMILSVFEYLQKLDSKNIVRYSKKQIEDQKIFGHYNDLRTITQVGPKIASFYLRDVVSVYSLDDMVPDDFQILLQPVDTWVHQMAVKLGIASHDESDDEIRKSIVDFCKARHLSAILFNQGLWYAGKNRVSLN